MMTVRAKRKLKAERPRVVSAYEQQLKGRHPGGWSVLRAKIKAARKARQARRQARKRP